MLTKALLTTYPTWLLGLIFFAVIILLLIRYADRNSKVASLEVLDRVVKMLAASGFVMVAVLRTSEPSTFATFILLGLVLSWLGDLLLTSSKSSHFKWGILAFLVGHLAYAAALLQKDIAGDMLAISALGLTILLALSWTWLRNHLDGDYKIYVPAYLLAISIMVTLALAFSLGSGDWVLALAAGCFAISDLFVARERFVSSSFANALLGLPLYFFGQILFALSI